MGWTEPAGSHAAGDAAGQCAEKEFPFPAESYSVLGKKTQPHLTRVKPFAALYEAWKATVFSWS